MQLPESVTAGPQRRIPLGVLNTDRLQECSEKHQRETEGPLASFNSAPPSSYWSGHQADTAQVRSQSALPPSTPQLSLCHSPPPESI